MNVRTWLHTCAGRKDKLGPTLESLDASDLKGKYEIIEAPLAPARVCNEWWKETMLRLAKEKVDGEVPDCIVRLEDDVIVNQHFLHNVTTWTAPEEPDFGMGLLFLWDGCWPPLPHMHRYKRKGALCRLDLDLPGAQAQMFKASAIPGIVGSIANAQRWWNPDVLIFDCVVTRATRLSGKYVYCHTPSLVNCHPGCTVAASGYKHQGHFSFKTYKPEWKRGRDPEPRRL